MDDKKNIILSLDISTSTIGVCLLLDDGSEYGQIIELTHICPKVPRKTDKHEALFMKTDIFKDEFLNKYKGYGITRCFIEAPLLSSNNSETVATLLQFNGMISLAVYNELGVVPEYISSYEARKYAFPELMGIRKYGKDERQYEYSKIKKEINDGKLVLFGSYPWTIDKKSVLQEKVAEIFPQIKWIYNKKGELVKQNFDASDAFVALLGGLNKERYGEINFSISNISEKSNGNESEISYDVHYWDKVIHRTTYVDKTIKKDNSK